MVESISRVQAELLPQEEKEGANLAVSDCSLDSSVSKAHQAVDQVLEILVWADFRCRPVACLNSVEGLIIVLLVARPVNYLEALKHYDLKLCAEVGWSDC